MTAIERGAVAALDLRTLTAHVRDVEGEPVLVLDDGDTIIELVCGLAGPDAAAVLAAERLQSVGALLAAELRRTAGQSPRNSGHFGAA